MMKDQSKKKQVLIQELVSIRQRIAELEQLETDLKQVEEALQESEERYRHLVEYAPTGIYEVDFTTLRFLQVNDAMCQYTGYTREEFLSMDPIQLLTEHSLKSFMQRHAKVIAGEPVPDNVEYQIKRKNGSEFWVILSHRYFYRPNDRILATVIAHDITERKLAEALLLQSEENFRRSLDDSPLGVRIVTIEGETIYANRAILNIYGYDGIEELRTTPLKERYTPESYSEFQIRREKRRRGDNEPSEYDICIVRKDGEVRHLHVSRKEALWDGERQFQVLYNDITERKRAEEALKASQQQLRALAGRLHSVREEQRKEFAREIHDQLGGAMTGLKIDLSFLASSAPKSWHITDRDSFLSRVNEMSKLIDKTIGTVRRLVTELRPNILDDFGILAALEWQLWEFQKRTGIQSEFVSTLKDINMDEELSITVFRIFQEALTNVSRHANATNVIATLYKEADSIVLKVEDNGKGISENDIHNAKSIGLTGMRERTLSLGGTISFSGEPSKGTTVSVQFPFQS